MLEQVEKIIDDFYATNSSEIEMSFYNLLEQLNLQDTDKDKKLLDDALRELQKRGKIICTLPAENVLYTFKKR